MKKLRCLAAWAGAVLISACAGEAPAPPPPAAEAPPVSVPAAAATPALPAELAHLVELKSSLQGLLDLTAKEGASVTRERLEAERAKLHQVLQATAAETPYRQNLERIAKVLEESNGTLTEAQRQELQKEIRAILQALAGSSTSTASSTDAAPVPPPPAPGGPGPGGPAPGGPGPAGPAPGRPGPGGPGPGGPRPPQP